MSNHKDGIYLYDYYKKKIDSFRGHMAKTQVDISSETIHDLRVDIKKIRSFFLLMEMLQPKKFRSKEHYEIFVELFNRAGRIRELHVNMDLFSKYVSPPGDIDGFKKFIESEIEKSGNEFKASLKNFKLKNLNLSEAEILKLCSGISEDIIIKKCGGFITKEFNSIRKIYYEGKSVTRFHKIRKHSRTLREIMNLLLLFKPDKKIKNNRKQIKFMEDKLGNWHDRMVLVNSLQESMKKDPTGQNKFQQLKKLLPVIKKDTDILLEKRNFRLKFI